jgi:hypothetical protein
MGWDIEISFNLSVSLKGRRALYTTSRFDEISASGYKLKCIQLPTQKT